MEFQKLIDLAKKEQIEDIEIYYSEGKTLKIDLFNGEVEKTTIHNSSVMSVRAIYNGKMSYLTFEDKDMDLLTIVNKIKENAESLTTLEEFEIHHL